MRDLPVKRPRLRQRMDERLRELLYEDPWKLGAKVLEVRGSVMTGRDRCWRGCRTSLNPP